MAEVETWRYRTELYESYQNVLSGSREALVFAFPNGDYLLDCRDDTGNLFDEPLVLFTFLWTTHTTQGQCNVEIDRADNDLLCDYDPSAPIANYFKQFQDARFRLTELGQAARANDEVLIRKSQAAIKKYQHLATIWSK